MKLDKYWYVILVPIIGFCYVTATLFLISGIMNMDADIIEAFKIYAAGILFTLVLYVPYKINTPSPKRLAKYKEKYDSLIKEYNVPENAKTIVIGKCTKNDLTETCAVIWRGAKTLRVLAVGENPELFEYNLSNFNSISRQFTTPSKDEIKAAADAWNRYDVYVKKEFDIFRPIVKDNTLLTYKIGDFVLSPHSCYILLGVMGTDLSGTAFDDGNRLENLETYFCDGAIPYFIYRCEKGRLA